MADETVVKPLDESELRRIRVQTEDRSPEHTVVRLLATLDERQARVVAYLRGWEDGPGFGYPDGMCDGPTNGRRPDRARGPSAGALGEVADMNAPSGGGDQEGARAARA